MYLSLTPHYQSSIEYGLRYDKNIANLCSLAKFQSLAADFR